MAIKNLTTKTENRVRTVMAKDKKDEINISEADQDQRKGEMRTKGVMSRAENSVSHRKEKKEIRKRVQRRRRPLQKKRRPSKRRKLPQSYMMNGRSHLIIRKRKILHLKRTRVMTTRIPRKTLMILSYNTLEKIPTNLLRSQNLGADLKEEIERKRDPGHAPNRSLIHEKRKKNLMASAEMTPKGQGEMCLC